MSTRGQLFQFASTCTIKNPIKCVGLVQSGHYHHYHYYHINQHLIEI